MTDSITKTPLDYPRICLHECHEISAFEGHLDCWSPDCQHPAHALEALKDEKQAAWIDAVRQSESPNDQPATDNPFA